MRFKLVVLAASVPFAARLAFAATPPAGFRDAELLSASAPTAIAYEPGTGNAFVLEKGDAGGNARVLRRALVGGAVTTALTLSGVDPNGERGLLGIAFDPDYVAGSSTAWVYLYYTKLTPGVGSRNRVVRFTEAGGVLSGEEVLLEGPVLGATNHNGGTLRFALDKTLFVSMGDNDTDADSIPKSRDLTDLRGKILRINRDGSAPASNPFFGQPPNRPEIWAWGLRNPFRFSIDPATGTPWIGDVGENSWEEIDRGAIGADYGYPCFEGDVSFRTCTPASPVAPALVYGHHFQIWPYMGSAVIGGPVYRGGNFPAIYDGRMFYGDYGDHWIRSAMIDALGTLSDVQLFMSDAGALSDIVQAPNGCLAWVDIVAGAVHETCYTAGNNHAPIARASATPASGAAPLTVQFTGSSSSDADGDPLSYSWAFGDGVSSVSSVPDPLHGYAAGVYSAHLTVDDQKGQVNSIAASPPIRVVSGNRPPEPAIAQPAAGAHYNAGDTIAFSGIATDPEDGTMPASGLSVTIVFHHEEHTHPFAGPIDGVSSGSFTVPIVGEDSTHVWFRVELTATDSGYPIGSGARVSSSTYVDVLPNIATMTLAARPAGEGLAVSFSGTEVAAPASYESVVNFPRGIAAPSPQAVGGRTWVFLRWEDTVGNARTIATPASNTTYTAVFGPDDDRDGFASANGDCDDADDTVYPGAPELCDGKDNDCNLAVDEATCAAFGGADGAVNGLDLSTLGRFFGQCSTSAPAQPWGEVDFTKDGCLDGKDLAVMAAVWGCSGSGPICP